MNKKLLTLAFAIFFLVGCTAVANEATKDNINSQSVPDWLVSAMKAEFLNPDLVKPNDITLAQVRLKETNEPQILAYLTIDRLNGVIMLFEDKGEGYKTVYKRNEPVYGIQIYGAGNGQLVSFITGFGGTGFQENNFYLIGYNSDSYKELWKDIAEKYNFGGPLPYSHTQGAINFDLANEMMIYTQQVRTYDKLEYNEDAPDKIENITSYFKFDHESGKLTLIDKR